MRYSKSSSKGEVYSDAGLSQEIRKISNKQPNFILEELQKVKNKTKVSRRKEIIKIRAETNEID